MNLQLILGFSIPFIGTSLGAAMVFFLRGELNNQLRKALLGFASGVMIAASFWSLLNPAIEMTIASGGIPWLAPAIGFIAGIGFLLLLDTVIPHLHSETSEPEGPKTSLKKNSMLFLAVTLHNIPEGLAVGITFAGALNQDVAMTMTGALALAIGIGIQNFPEGAIISLPMRSEGSSRRKAFLMGVGSGVVEPIGAIITLFLAGFILPLMPFMLAFAAGAMIYVVVEELIPEAMEGKHSNIATIGVAIGFVLMMILDVALG